MTETSRGTLTGQGFFATAVFLLHGLGLAQVSVTPPNITLNLSPGANVPVAVQVCVTGPPAMADVYLLADTTGSMSSVLSSVQANANTIVNTLLTNPATSIQVGIGNYKDFPADGYAFQHQVAITNNGPAITAAINDWSAEGGEDLPETQFFALNHIALDTATTGWRPGAVRIIVWFGDAPGHDPICAAISGEAEITEASVTANLVSGACTVIAIGTPAGTANDLNGDPTTGNDYVPFCGLPGGLAGQATRITTATGGTYLAGVTPAQITAAILNAISGTLGNVDIGVGFSPSLASFVSSVVPPVYPNTPVPAGTMVCRDFTVSFTGPPCTPGINNFFGTLDALINNTTQATSVVAITQTPGCPSPPASSNPMGVSFGRLDPDDLEPVDCFTEFFPGAPIVSGVVPFQTQRLVPTGQPPSFAPSFAGTLRSAAYLGTDGLTYAYTYQIELTSGTGSTRAFYLPLVELADPSGVGLGFNAFRIADDPLGSCFCCSPAPGCLDHPAFKSTPSPLSAFYPTIGTGVTPKKGSLGNGVLSVTVKVASPGGTSRIFGFLSTSPPRSGSVTLLGSSPILIPAGAGAAVAARTTAIVPESSPRRIAVAFRGWTPARFLTTGMDDLVSSLVLQGVQAKVYPPGTTGISLPKRYPRKALHFLLTRAPQEEDVVALIGHSHGGHRAYTFSCELTTSWELPPDALFAIDPIDYELAGCSSFLPPITCPLPNQSTLLKPAPCGTPSVCFVQRTGTGVPLSNLFSIDDLQGYSVASLATANCMGTPSLGASCIVDPTTHVDIDDDRYVHNAIRTILGGLVQ